MITSQKVGNRTVFWTDNEKERADLVEKRHVVYTAQESAICEARKDVLGDEFRTLLFQMKLIAPETRLVGVQ